MSDLPRLASLIFAVAVAACDSGSRDDGGAGETFATDSAIAEPEDDAGKDANGGQLTNGETQAGGVDEIPDEGGLGADAGKDTQAVRGDAVRFVAFGDSGTGDAAQKKVADAIASVCAQHGCDFALYLGDNIYESGATGTDDAQFRDKFEIPFAALDFRFYVALGNHDYGSGGSNIAPNNAQSKAQIEYTQHSKKWYLPNYYYAFREGPIAFFALDTNSVVMPEQFPLGGSLMPPAPADEQQAWLQRAMAASDAPWKMVFGHHPYVSNGEHGNAGDYAAFGEAKGVRLKQLFEESVCGAAQVYFSGHDHDREWLEPVCGTSFIVSGAGAKLRSLPGQGSPSRWSDATKHGFLWAEVSGETMTGVFYDEDGLESYRDTVARLDQ
ncbi:MAG TPA: metallophosphoesterase [Polyangiales bacterium]